MSLNRYAKRRDANEAEIVKALEAIGCGVERIDKPADLLVGYRAKTFLIEIKAPGGRITPAQKAFARGWPGQYRIVETAEDAIECVTKAYVSKP